METQTALPWAPRASLSARAATLSPSRAPNQSRRRSHDSGGNSRHEPGGERDERADEGLGLGFAFRLRGGVPQMLHEGRWMDSPLRIEFRFVLGLQFLLRQQSAQVG